MYKVIQRFCNDEYDNGLLLLDMPTGSGKTYSVLNYIFDAVQNSDDKRRYFFITTLKKNLPIEDLRKRFETAGKLDIYKEKFLFVDSNSESVISGFTKDVIAAIPYEIKKTNEYKKVGTAFTYEEEKKLVNHCLAHLNRDTAHAFLVLLYAGLRRSELASINVIDGVWLECETSKERMGKNVVKRKIPITPMMKQVLPYIDFEKAKRVNLSTLQTTMKRLFPNHHSHELRHTFISRSKESGVLSEVVSIWAGHSLSGTITTTVYTHYSEEFQLREAEKVDYLKLDFGVN